MFATIETEVEMVMPVNDIRGAVGIYILTAVSEDSDYALLHQNVKCSNKSLSVLSSVEMNVFVEIGAGSNRRRCATVAAHRPDRVEIKSCRSGVGNWVANRI